ncbi:MAG: ATP-binding protein, partial [Roseibium sp.]|uniref:ATP-binding protein n=1 Tax=Roseibium sp. TaxID=1936156 RepID=UPI003297036A
MPVISVPKEFFVSERNTVYGSWGSAYWRELLSNSIDAGASQIMIRGNFTDDEKFRIDFLDNGKGMSREIVEDVYMRLGESTKKEEDGIGGFGRARILTCFSQESYKIRTRDIVVSGQGASYDIEQSDRTVKGCAITTSMPASDARRLINGLRDVLRQSHLKCSVVLSLPEERPDGGSVPQIDSAHLTDAPNGKKFTGWSHKGRSFRTLSDEKGEWGTAYISNGATAVRHSSIVRVNGMAMYEDHLGV